MKKYIIIGVCVIVVFGAGFGIIKKSDWIRGWMKKDSMPVTPAEPHPGEGEPAEKAERPAPPLPGDISTFPVEPIDIQPGEFDRLP